MKQALFIIVTLLMATCQANVQTQKGIVKTRSR